MAIVFLSSRELIWCQASARTVETTEAGDVNRYEAEGATIAIRAISCMRRGAVRESNDGWRQELTLEDLGGVRRRLVWTGGAQRSTRVGRVCDPECFGVLGGVQVGHV